MTSFGDPMTQGGSLKLLSYLAIVSRKIDNVDLDNERVKLLVNLKGGSLQAMPIDILQVVHRLQVLYYINKLFQLEDEDDTDS